MRALVMAYDAIMPSRRSFLASPVASVPLLATLGAAAEERPDHPRVLVTGAHPDDPETGCGGAIAAMADAGWEVHVLYLTRGQAGIAGTAADEAAGIRTAEAERACDLLRAVPHFLTQVDGATELTAASAGEMRGKFDEVQPHLTLTHWPIDTHPDHRVCSLLTLDAWSKAEPGGELYYYEVMTGTQTQTFSPTQFVDITATASRKREACVAHRSQKIAEQYVEHEQQIALFRGRQAGVRMAEAFVPHATSAAARMMR